MTEHLTIVVVGGGAAGFFAAATCAQQYPQHQIILLEKTKQVLSKVKISGGGRCNVTHSCFDPSDLVKNYPRGNKELRGPFTHFQPQDTIHWFESRGVPLKAEEDGRIFPISNQSESIIQCLWNESNKVGVKVLLEHGLEGIEKIQDRFILNLSHGKDIECDRVLIATGSSSKIFSLMEKLGHVIISPVPSLFTFNIPDSPFHDLSGVSIPSVLVRLPKWNLEQQGPLLFTHWGLSGPAVLKLSAWGARELHLVDYQTEVSIDWIPQISKDKTKDFLIENKRTLAARHITTDSCFSLPKQLWKKLLFLSQIHDGMRWSEISNHHLLNLTQQLHSTSLNIRGKTTYKQEFVTCGGIALEEINFKTMESKRCSGLFFAGEVLNIDGITGGFNFQNAWTTGWIAGKAIGKEKT